MRIFTLFHVYPVDPNLLYSSFKDKFGSREVCVVQCPAKVCKVNSEKSEIEIKVKLNKSD